MIFSPGSPWTRFKVVHLHVFGGFQRLFRGFWKYMFLFVVFYPAQAGVLCWFYFILLFLFLSTGFNYHLFGLLENESSYVSVSSCINKSKKVLNLMHNVATKRCSETGKESNSLLKTRVCCWRPPTSWSDDYNKTMWLFLNNYRSSTLSAVPDWLSW